MPFQNPITGGQGALVRPAIKSPNFVSGSTGWIVRADGSAEFNNLIVRGGTVVGGVALYYSGAPALGNLVASIAAAGGVDALGNVYLSGINTYAPDGSGVRAYQGAYASPSLAITDSAITTYMPPSQAGSVFVPGAVLAESQAGGNTQLIMASPSDANNVGDGQALIELTNRGSSGSSTISLDGDLAFLDTTQLNIGSTHWSWTGILDNGRIVSAGPSVGACTVATTAASTTPTNITGQTITITPPSNATGTVTYEVDMIIDCICSTFAAGIVAVGRLLVDGVLVSTPTAPWGPTAAGERAPVVGKWTGTVSAGVAHTFQAAIALSAGVTARYQAQVGNSTVTAKTYSS